MEAIQEKEKGFVKILGLGIRNDSFVGLTKNKKDNNLLEENSIIDLKKKMLEYAENLDFEKAAEIRDKIKILEKKEMGISESL